MTPGLSCRGAGAVARARAATAGGWFDRAPRPADLGVPQTAHETTPTIFRNFQGTLDAFGAGSAQVDIPASIPRGLNLTVFVAGILYDNQGVVQVTPSHWLVLG